MTASSSVSTASQRILGPGFDSMPTGLVLVGAPPAVGKTCFSLNLAVHFAGHLGESVLYISTGSPKEVILTRLAKNMTAEGASVDPTVVSGLPLVVFDGNAPSSALLVEAVTNYVAEHDQPSLVLVNDLQNIHPPKEGLSGLDAAIEIMADMHAIVKLCDAPVVLFSQLAEGKSISRAVAEQADRVIIAGLASEDPTHKRLTLRYYDPPEPEAESYELVLTRTTGVMGVSE